MSTPTRCSCTAGMDIGTAKLTAGERGGVPHHLLDIWDVTRGGERRRVPAAGPRRHRRTSQARGRVPILVGGSGLYVRAALDDLDFPGTDPALRGGAGGRAGPDRPRPLHARLARLDPAAAAAILPSNGRRIVRALEVIELSGPAVQRHAARVRAVLPAVQIGLRVARAELDQRIAARVDGCGGPGSWREVAPWRGRPARGPDRQPRPGLRAGAAVPGRGVAPRSRPGGDCRARPGGSPAVRSRGSGATRGSAGCRWTPQTDLRREPAWSRRHGYDRRMRFAKGHGTENDFVILPDPDDASWTDRRAWRPAL